MTPHESEARRIVALIGNIANRPDIREVQERQVAEIAAALRDAEARGEARGREEGAEREWRHILEWKPYLHYCRDWDFLLIDKSDGEFEACTCFPTRAAERGARG